jgi:hypothetical protein
VSGPGHAGFGIVLGGLSGDWRDADKMITVWALNLAAGKLLVALKVLTAMRAGEFEFTHKV